MLALVHIWIVHSFCINNNVVWHTCGNAIRCTNRPSSVCVCVKKNAKMMEGAHRFYSMLLDYINDATEQNEHQHHPRMGKRHRRLEMKFILESMINKTRYSSYGEYLSAREYCILDTWIGFISCRCFWPCRRKWGTWMRSVAYKKLQISFPNEKTGVIFNSDIWYESWIIYFLWRGGAQREGENLYCVRFFMFAIVYRISNHHAKWKWNRIYILKIRFAIFIKDTATTIRSVRSTERAVQYVFIIWLMHTKFVVYTYILPIFSTENHFISCAVSIFVYILPSKCRQMNENTSLFHVYIRHTYYVRSYECPQNIVWYVPGLYPSSDGCKCANSFCI